VPTHLQSVASLPWEAQNGHFPTMFNHDFDYLTDIITLRLKCLRSRWNLGFWAAKGYILSFCKRTGLDRDREDFFTRKLHLHSAKDHQIITTENM